METAKKQKETIILNIDDKIKVVRLTESTENLQLMQGYEKDGELKWQFRGYHQSIKQALEHIIRNEMLVERKEYKTIQEYVDEVNKSNGKIYRYLEEIK